MGMIMKDGIPYGGIYPIDDAPTQGSNNAVKSGGVHSALSNKVDKVAGKGLSTNDYDDTEKGKVADNAGAIEAIVNEYGAKNLLPLNINDPTLKNGGRNPGTWNGNVYTLYSASLTFDVTNDGYIKSISLSGTPDSDFVVWLNIDKYSKYNGCILSGKPVTDIIEFGITKPASPWTTYVRDDGEGVLINNIPTNEYQGVPLTIHAGNLLDGLVVYPMIRDARIKDSTYVPYAMTNRELTAKVEKGSVSIPVNTSMTLGQAVETIYNAIDKTKITKDSKLDMGGAIFIIRYLVSTANTIDCRMVCANAASIDEIYFIEGNYKFLNTSLPNAAYAVDKSSDAMWATTNAIFYY